VRPSSGGFDRDFKERRKGEREEGRKGGREEGRKGGREKGASALAAGFALLFWLLVQETVSVGQSVDPFCPIRHTGNEGRRVVP